MTKISRIIVSTDAGRGLRLDRKTGKLSLLETPAGEKIFFWDGLPFAAWDGSYLYTLGNPSPGQHRALHDWMTTQIRMPINDFEYTVGQMLSKAGLHLVRRLDP